MPFFNAARTLALAVRSVFAQTHTDWELLLLDDGSTDGSLQIARSIRDPRVRVIADGDNKGLTARLNELTQASRAPVIARMDADDAMHPTRLDRQLRLLHEQPDVDLVGGRCWLMNSAGEVYGLDSYEGLDPDPGHFLRASGVFHHPTITARREWMLRNPYDTAFRLGQERELFCRTYAASTFAKIEEPLLFYREGGKMKLSTYRTSRAMDRRLIHMYGRGQMGRGERTAVTTKSYLKEAVYSGAHALRAVDWLDEAIARRRSDPMPTDTMLEARTAMQTIDDVVVPGLDA